MKFKTFITELKAGTFVVLTKVGAGLVEVAYTDDPDKNTGFSKGTVSISKLNGIWSQPKHIVYDQPIMISKEIKDKIDSLLHVEAQKQIHK